MLEKLTHRGFFLKENPISRSFCMELLKLRIANFETTIKKLKAINSDYM